MPQFTRDDVELLRCHLQRGEAGAALSTLNRIDPPKGPRPAEPPPPAWEPYKTANYALEYRPLNKVQPWVVVEPETEERAFRVLSCFATRERAVAFIDDHQETHDAWASGDRTAYLEAWRRKNRERAHRYSARAREKRKARKEGTS